MTKKHVRKGFVELDGFSSSTPILYDTKHSETDVPVVLVTETYYLKVRELIAQSEAIVEAINTELH